MESKKLNLNDFIEDINTSFMDTHSTEVPLNLDRFYLKKDGRDIRGFKFYNEFDEELMKSTGKWSWGYKFKLKEGKRNLGEFKGNLQNINTVQIFDDEKKHVASFIKRNTEIEYEKEATEISWLQDRVIGVFYSNSEPLLLRLMGELPSPSEFPRIHRQFEGPNYTEVRNDFMGKLIANNVYIDVVNPKNKNIAKINMPMYDDNYSFNSAKFNVQKTGSISQILLAATSLLSTIFLIGFSFSHLHTSALFYNAI